MDKKLTLGAIIVVAAVLAGIAFLYGGGQNASPQNSSQQNSSMQYEATTPINPPVTDTYINFRNGTPSRIYLVDSSAAFGTFAEDRVDQYPPGRGAIEACKGDRFVSIGGTIRNDYDRLLYIALDARVYDRKGNQIGTLLRSSGRPEFKAALMGLDSNESGQFGLMLKCDPKYTFSDTGRYEVILAWDPGPTPPP